MYSDLARGEGYWRKKVQMFFTGHYCSCHISPLSKPLSPFPLHGITCVRRNLSRTAMKELHGQIKILPLLRKLPTHKCLDWDHMGEGRWVPVAVPAAHCEKGHGHSRSSSIHICSSCPRGWDSPLCRGQPKCTNLPHSKKVFGRIWRSSIIPDETRQIEGFLHN